MKVIRLTGADTYASERTYGFMLRRNQTIKLRDQDANRILQSTQSGVALFTLTALTTATFDATERYNGDDPVVYDVRESLFLVGDDRKTRIPASVSGDGLRFRNGPILVAHRGGSKTQTEDSMQAIKKARSAGVTHIEFDVFKLASGGKLGLHHDTTIDRVTGGTGNTESQTVANWLALTNDVYATIAPGILSGAPTLLDEVLDWARDNEAVLWIEPKAASGNGLDTYRRLNAELAARSWPRSRVVIETFSTGVASAAAADGWRSWYLVGSGYTTADIDAAVAANAWAVGMPFSNWTAPLVTYAKARGLVAVAYTVDRRFDAATVAGYGVDYIVTGDPVYLSETVRLARDVWDTQAYAPGMLESGAAKPTDTGVGRGQWFSANGYYGWPTAAQHDACLQGYACPIKGNPNADSFSIRWQFQFNTVSADNRWVGVHCCAADDRPYQDTLATLLGYNILSRRNASVDIYSTPASGASTQIATSGTGTNLTLDTTYTAEVVVTPTTVTATLYAANGTTVIKTTSVASTHSRGGYFHLGRNGCQVHLIPGSLVIA